MIPILVNLSTQQAPIVGGRRGEHNFRELVLTLPDELKTSDIDHYIITFADESGNAYTSEQLTLDENETLHYPLPLQITKSPTVTADITAFDIDGTQVEKYGKSPTVSLIFLESVDSDNAETIDETEKGIVAQAFEIADKFDETPDGQPTYNGEPIIADIPDNVIPSVSKYSDLPEDADAGQACYVANAETGLKNITALDFNNPDRSDDTIIFFDNAFLKENPPKPTSQDYSVYDWKGIDSCALLTESGNAVLFSFYFIYVIDKLCLYLVIDNPDPDGEEYVYIYTWEDMTFDAGYGPITVYTGWNWEVVPEEQYQYVTFDETGLNDVGLCRFLVSSSDGSFFDWDTEIQTAFQNLFAKGEKFSHPKGMYVYNEGWQFNGIEETKTVENYDSTGISLMPENNTVYLFGAIEYLHIMEPPADNHYSFTVLFNTAQLGATEYYTNIVLPDTISWQNGAVPSGLIGTSSKNAILTIEHGIARLVIGGETGV